MQQPDPAHNPPNRSPGCSQHTAWLGASFVLPLASPNFYQQAARRPARWAFSFYAILIFTVTTLTILGNSRDMYRAQSELLALASAGDFPVITIQDGKASSSGQQPFVVLDGEGSFFAMDTSGQLTGIDQDEYISGLLLTETELHVLNLFEYQRIDLDELHTMTAQNPIVLDQYWFENTLTTLTSIFFVALTVVLLVWNFIFRSIYMLVLAWMIYTTSALFNQHSTLRFSKVLAIGLYATLPAMVFYYLFTLIGIYIPLLQSILLLAFWGVALYLSERAPGEPDGPPPIIKIWLVPLGLPMLLALALNVVYHWPQATTPLTMLTVVTIGLIAYLDSHPLPADFPPENL